MLPAPELAKVCQLTNLKTLDLTGNNLAVLPDRIGDLRKLEELTLTFNNLPVEEIAKVATLTHLKSLNISSNNLGSLPLQLGQLRNLKTLDISDNHIEQDDDYAVLISQLPADLEIIDTPAV